MFKKLFEKKIPAAHAAQLTAVSLISFGLGAAVAAFGVSRGALAWPIYIVAGIAFIGGILHLA